MVRTFHVCGAFHFGGDVSQHGRFVEQRPDVGRAFPPAIILAPFAVVDVTETVFQLTF